MTEDTIAIVAPAVDTTIMERRIQTAWIAVQKGNASAADARRRADQQRLALGRLLVDARPAWPASGPPAAGWGAFLEKVGIPERTARRYMRLAGYVEISDTVSETIPSYSEAGIKSKPRTKPDPEPEVKLGASIPAAWKRDADRGFVGSCRLIRTLAGAWPGATRRRYVAMLRAELERIESMPDDSADEAAP
jgi:hypothetical protein